ncbi:MAG: tyrosine-type recombinase/integrase [Thermoanaerobaculia bacterium]
MAHKLLDKRLREVANHLDGTKLFMGPNQERVTMKQLFDQLEADYRQREIKSLKATLGHMKPVRAYFGNVKALKVTPERVRAYVVERQKAGLANASVNRELEIIRRSFRLANDDARLTYSPRIRSLHVDNARQGFFEKAEFEAVEKALRDPLNDMARFAYLTGWRRSEVASLGWENVDRSAREVRLITSKNGEGRAIKLDPLTWALIEKRWVKRPYDNRGEEALSAYVFHRGGKLLGNFSKEWNAACVEANVGRYVEAPVYGGRRYEGKLFHDLRRTAVRDMVRAGVNQHVAMAISGHKTASMFQRYNITSQEDIESAFKMRGSYLAGRDARPKVVALRSETRTVARTKAGG